VLKNAIDWASRPYGDSAWQGKPVAAQRFNERGELTDEASRDLIRKLLAELKA
jgi:chromate reductase